MVLIETVKRLLPLRGAYNRRQVALWLGERAGDDGAAAMGQLVRAMDLVPAAPETDRDDSSRVDRATGRRWQRVFFPGPGVGGAFNLPAEQLSAQVAAAAERASQESARYEELILALCPSLSRDDLRSMQRHRADRGAGPDPAVDLPYRIASAIDQLQIRLGGRWRHYLQITAWSLTGPIALLLAVAEETPATFVLAALVFGGFFAWLARDLSAIAERLRR